MLLFSLVLRELSQLSSGSLCTQQRDTQQAEAGGSFIVCNMWVSGAMSGFLPVLQEHRGLLTIRYPMEHGVVRDWNDMERIWQYVYSKDQLQTFSEEVWYPPSPPHSQLSDCLSIGPPVVCVHPVTARQNVPGPGVWIQM